MLRTTASPIGPPSSIFLDEKVHSSEAKLSEASSWREVDWNGGATMRCLDELRSVA
jgi:hypothetical protein